MLLYNKSCKARGRSVLNYAQFLYLSFLENVVKFPLCIFSWFCVVFAEVDYFLEKYLILNDLKETRSATDENLC